MLQHEFSLAELIVAAASEAWRGESEQLVTGIGPLPRLAAGLAKLTHSPGIMMTDGEALLVEDPIPLGPRGDYKPRYSGWMPYRRVFDTVWSGKRHAMVTPVQMDRWGQGNISALGGDLQKPKVAMLGLRGFPGNSICHKNSMFLPNHSKRTFVEGQVDVVSSVGYRQDNWPEGTRPADVQIGLIVTNLCIFDFGGPDHAARLLSLHPGVSFEEVQDNTGFPLLKPETVGVTQGPTPEQMEIIQKLDPHNIRATVLKGNPPGLRSAA